MGAGTRWILGQYDRDRMTKVTYIGHSTLFIEMDGLRILTDPLLKRYVGHLRRQVPDPDPVVQEADVVLISHLHGDHLDLSSLQQLGREKRIIVPRGAGTYLRVKRFKHVEEIAEGESIDLGGVTIKATRADHAGRKLPWVPHVQELGFLIDGSHEIYFAGDTDLFEEMADIGQEIDLALLPVWGWGPTLGPGHMDPQRAAHSLGHIQPKAAVPIHWGTYCPIVVEWFRPKFLSQPPLEFADLASEIAPDVTIQIVDPGDSLDVGQLIREVRGSPPP
jgi:L-ascorbate metabolism protein UlaG (beta-lactamase superfamily)